MADENGPDYEGGEQQDTGRGQQCGGLDNGRHKANQTDHNGHGDCHNHCISNHIDNVKRFIFALSKSRMFIKIEYLLVNLRIGQTGNDTIKDQIEHGGGNRCGLEDGNCYGFVAFDHG